jgi:hypothetical protein
MCYAALKECSANAMSPDIRLHDTSSRIMQQYCVFSFRLNSCNTENTHFHASVEFADRYAYQQPDRNLVCACTCACVCVYV